MGLSLYNQQAFVTKEARELLFEGYEDDLISMAQQISQYGPIKLNIPYDRFGWMYGVSLIYDFCNKMNKMIKRNLFFLEFSEMKVKTWLAISTLTLAPKTFLNWEKPEHGTIKPKRHTIPARVMKSKEAAVNSIRLAKLKTNRSHFSMVNFAVIWICISLKSKK